jgi:DNA-binding response OmpR family regulator
MRILVVEDEKQLAGIIKRGLEEEGYAVDVAGDGEEGQYYAENTAYDLILLDIMLPKKDGLEVCRDLRLKKLTAPIMMLTAKDKVQDRVEGLDCGADDYLVKPFAFPELHARIRALLRREAAGKSPLLAAGGLTLDPASHLVKMDGRDIDLTGKEYALLEYLMRNPGRLLTRTMLEEHVWNYEFEGGSNIVDVYVRRLRDKIDPENGTDLIQTIRGAGYRLKAG